MSLIKRFSYYFFGLSIGLVILSFFLSGKKTSCNYGPESRVINELLKKEIIIEKITDFNYKINTDDVKEFIKNSSVDFSNSNTSIDSCKIYNLTGYLLDEYKEILFENCAKTVRALSIK